MGTYSRRGPGIGNVNVKEDAGIESFKLNFSFANETAFIDAKRRAAQVGDVYWDTARDALVAYDGTAFTAVGASGQPAESTGAITLAVDIASGSDTAITEDVVLSGNFSSTPLATLAKAVSLLPVLKHSATITVTTGTVVATTIALIRGTGTLTISGASTTTYANLILNRCEAPIVISDGQCTASVASGTLQVDQCADVKVEDFSFTTSSSAKVANCTKIEFDNCIVDNAGLAFQKIGDLTFDVDADNCAAAAVDVDDCDTVVGSMDAENCTGTPLTLDKVQAFSIGANGLVGSTGNTAYGVIAGNSGYYDMTGATITGTTGDFQAAGYATTWSNLNTNESVLHRGLSLVWIT